MGVPMRYFALFTLYFFSIASSSSLELFPVVRREDIVPNLPWKPKQCYRRTQVCCYRYKKCGHRCRTGYCSQKPMCTHTKFGKCFRWRSVNACTTVCFDKMCVRFECVPLNMERGPSYDHPKIHTQVYYPEGREPPKPPKPSSRPSRSPIKRPVKPTQRPRPRPRPVIPSSRPRPRPGRPPRRPRNPLRPHRPPRSPRKTKPPQVRPPRDYPQRPDPPRFPGFPGGPGFPGPPGLPAPPKLPRFPGPPNFPGGGRPARPPKRPRDRPPPRERPARKKKRTFQRPPRGSDPSGFSFVSIDNPLESIERLRLNQ